MGKQAVDFKKLRRIFRESTAPQDGAEPAEPLGDGEVFARPLLDSEEYKQLQYDGLRLIAQAPFSRLIFYLMNKQ